MILLDIVASYNWF